MASLVNVAEVLTKPGEEAEFEGEVDVSAVTLPLGIRAAGPIYFQATVRNVGDGLLLEGEGQAPVILQCSRCAEEFEESVGFTFSEMFVAGPVDEEQEGEVFAFEDQEIDLAPAVEQAAVLALPIRPLCDERCAGLCPRCGKNLNQGPCGCPQEQLDERWAKLKDLARTDKEEV